ncbi:MAG TPA: hypothetical protein VF743_11330 [Acidimicrobiales bacterium]
MANDRLTVITGSGDDRIALRLAAGSADTLQIDLGDDGSADRSFDRDRFSQIVVISGSGADHIRIDQVNGVIADESVDYFTGSGDDTVDGGDAVERFHTGSGDDAVDGNRGNDRGELGSGRDSFRWDPGDGSDVVEGGTGSDTLDFNGAVQDEIMSLTPNGRRALFLRNLGNIRMDTDDVERLDLTALGGADTVTVDDMSGTDFRQADVDLGGAGDGGTDTVTVEGTEGDDDIDVVASGARVDVDGLQVQTRVAGADPTDRLEVDARGGDDDVEVDPAAEALIEVLVDLGTGQG